MKSSHQKFFVKTKRNQNVERNLQENVRPGYKRTNLILLITFCSTYQGNTHRWLDKNKEAASLEIRFLSVSAELAGTVLRIVGHRGKHERGISFEKVPSWYAVGRGYMRDFLGHKRAPLESAS